MRTVMKKIIQKSIAEFSPETREQWLVSYPSQVIGVVSQIIFTRYMHLPNEK